MDGSRNQKKTLRTDEIKRRYEISEAEQEGRLFCDEKVERESGGEETSFRGTVHSEHSEPKNMSSIRRLQISQLCCSVVTCGTDCICYLYRESGVTCYLGSAIPLRGTLCWSQPALSVIGFPSSQRQQQEARSYLPCDNQHRLLFVVSCALSQTPNFGPPLLTLIFSRACLLTSRFLYFPSFFNGHLNRLWSPQVIQQYYEVLTSELMNYS